MRTTRRSLLAASAAGLVATAGCTALAGPDGVEGDRPTRGHSPTRASRRPDGGGPEPLLTVRWTADRPGDGGSTVVADGILYAPDKEYGSLQVLDRETGDRLDSERAGRDAGDIESDASPAVVDGVAYYTTPGTVYAVGSYDLGVGG